MPTEVVTLSWEAALGVLALVLLCLLVAAMALFVLARQWRGVHQMLTLAREATAFNRELFTSLLSVAHAAEVASRRADESAGRPQGPAA